MLFIHQIESGIQPNDQIINCLFSLKTTKVSTYCFRAGLDAIVSLTRFPESWIKCMLSLWICHRKKSSKTLIQPLSYNYGFQRFYPYTLMCVSTVYSVLSRALWKKKSQACYLGGIWTHDLCNSRAVSYQLDHWDCPVARGSLKVLSNYGSLL